MPYVDGFVIPIPKRNVTKYQRMARKAGKIWREHGAIDYHECVGDDLAPKMPGMTFPPPFPTHLGLKRGETVVFAWITFRSRAHRDRVNAKVMKDPRILKMMDAEPLMDEKRMLYGGFKTIV